MPYLIDGHNLIGALPDIHLHDPDDELQLVRRLQRFCARTGKKVSVIFDQGLPGGEGIPSSGRLNVRFVSPPRTADDGIRGHLARLGKESSNWIVVSSDRAVQRAAAHARARHLSSQAFAPMLEPAPDILDDGEKPVEPQTSADLEEWEKIFNSRNSDS